ncbi:RelB/DinJ family addiction module antitoxin [Firmicutes bacterium M10-2]|nr:RelB/DinJ family addiction module antitoxin [Firmicutes bacterium M10-2]
MEKATMDIEMNEDLKENFDAVCKDLGLDPQTAINIFAKKMVNEQAVPFEITEKDYPIDEDEERKARCKKIAKGALIGAGIGLACSGIVRLIVRFAKKEVRKEEKKLLFWK